MDLLRPRFNGRAFATLRDLEGDPGHAVCVTQTSAGILLYRCGGCIAEILLVHPGGPFWAKKDLGA
jgi:hypothetical protein